MFTSFTLYPCFVPHHVCQTLELLTYLDSPHWVDSNRLSKYRGIHQSWYGFMWLKVVLQHVLYIWYMLSPTHFTPHSHPPLPLPTPHQTVTLHMHYIPHVYWCNTKANRGDYCENDTGAMGSIPTYPQSPDLKPNPYSENLEINTKSSS